MIGLHQYLILCFNSFNSMANLFRFFSSVAKNYLVRIESLWACRILDWRKFYKKFNWNVGLMNWCSTSFTVWCLYGSRTLHHTLESLQCNKFRYVRTEWSLVLNLCDERLLRLLPPKIFYERIIQGRTIVTQWNCVTNN